MLTNEDVNLIASQSILAHTLSDKDLLEFCIIANQSYRSGNPIVSDENYDFIFIAELAKRMPNHPFLKNIEVEDEGFSEEKINLRMIQNR